MRARSIQSRKSSISGSAGTSSTRTQQGVPSPLARAAKNIGYIRVSTKEQRPELQFDAMTIAGCDVVYSDHGVSGRKAKRKRLSAVLAELQAGDTLTVWRIDRLGRVNVELLLLRDQFIRRKIRLVSLTQAIDTSTSLGRYNYAVEAARAEYEWETISERTRAGMAAARRRGTHLGRISNARLREAHLTVRRRTTSMRNVSKRFGVSEDALRSGFRRLRLEIGSGT